MASRRRRSRSQLDISPLEQRTLLSGPQAIWLGQDGHDLVGPYAGAVPDGVQDIHIRVEALDPARPVLTARLLGLGGSEWVYGIASGSWSAALATATGVREADLYVQPDRAEVGRPFNLIVTFADGKTADLWFEGGTSDPSLRMPDAQVRAAWLGQQGTDQTGPGAAVGPDGVQDVRIELTGLAVQAGIASIDVAGPSGLAWSFGLNPRGHDNAEFARNANDASRGILSLSPDRDLAGATLTIDVVYATGHVDSTLVTAGATDARLLAEPGPQIGLRRPDLALVWKGQQQGTGTDRRGWASLEVRGLPSGPAVTGATLNNGQRTSWTYRAAGSDTDAHYSDPYSEPLAFEQDGADATRARVAFAPNRDEAGSQLLLRVSFDDGSWALGEVTAGGVDLSQLSPLPAEARVVAAPGANLNALARVYGTIELSPGVYRQSEPLVLPRPVTLRAPAGGATLMFSQAANTAPWADAITVHAGNTVLDGFAVRFEGPVRWNWGVRYGPALIGTTDPFDAAYRDARANLSFTNLNLEAPPAATQGEEAPRLLRLASAGGGRIANNRLRGGTVEFLRGPWTVEGNRFLGTRPGTWSWDVFAGHLTHDLVLRNNLVEPLDDSGVTYRFLVLTGSGDGDRVEGNLVRGLGARDVVEQGVNAHELVLTEAYSVRFEGRLKSLSADGRLIRIPEPQGDAPTTGDVVAVVSGPHAGTWVRVAQAHGPTALVLSSPLPQGDYDVSISAGFVNERFVGNDIGAGAAHASNLVLLGAMFGTEVVGNTLRGGSEGVRAVAYPTERPVMWGWSHTPVFDLNISDNLVIDAARGFVLGVEHGGASKASAGRVYQTGELLRNTVRWSGEYAADPARLPRAVVVGTPRALDAGETRLRALENRANAPAGFPAAKSLLATAGRVNGELLVDVSISLPDPLPWTAPLVRLLNDTGASATDRVTADAALVVGSAEGATGTEYRVGDAGPFVSVGSAGTFVPTGVREGWNTVSVRGVNGEGIAGPATLIEFRLDTQAPFALAPALDARDDTGQWDGDKLTKATTLRFLAASDAGDEVELLRDGEVVARGAPGALVDEGPLPSGVYAYAVRRTDTAGNVSTSAATAVTVDTTPPLLVLGVKSDGAGRVAHRLMPGVWRYEYRVGEGSFQVVTTPGSFIPAGLLFGANPVELRAVDMAGNVGPARAWVVKLVPKRPAGLWVGQDNRDFAGPYPFAVADGIQDIHIQLGGLRANKTLTLVDIQGHGGSRWQFGGASGHWKVVLVRAKGATTADLYLQPDRDETGREFEVNLHFGDGTRSQFWMEGGKADPNLRVRPVPAASGRPLAAKPQGLTRVGPRLARWLAARRRGKA